MDLMALKRTLPALLAALAFAGSAQAADEGFKTGAFDPPRMAPEFELPASNGSTLTMGKLRGKVVIVEFGFTYCPRICPVTLANLSEVWKRLGPAAADVQLVFVTVDPDRDSPERLREFLHFLPALLGDDPWARKW